MTKLSWGDAGQRFYETGIDRGVLYLTDSLVVPWNGLTGVDEDFGNDTSTPYFLDGVKYLDVPHTGDFAATIRAFTYPDEFLEYEGIQEIGTGLYVDDQKPESFGLSYRTRIGNDQDEDLGYKLHICYNLTAVQPDTTYSSQGATPALSEFSWAIAGIPEKVPGYAPTAHVILDSRYINPRLLSYLEDILYGTDASEPSLPSLEDLKSLATDWRLITVTDHGDGTATVSAPDDLFTEVEPGWYKLKVIDTSVFFDTTDPNKFYLSDSLIEGT